MAANVRTILSILMGLCFLIHFCLITIQIKGFQWYSIFMKDNSIFTKKRERFCLYGVYILAALCSLQCLLNHISKYFPEQYCRYGMSICVILHEAAKTSQYGFFLERAKSAIDATKIDIVPTVITKYILPIYISLYFVLYSVICPWTFRGLPTNRNKKPFIPTDCLFDQYQILVFYLSVAVEIFNSIFFVYLFAYPLYKLYKINNAHIELIKMVKYNIIFSSISCISSVVFLLYRAFAKDNESFSYYLWLAGNIDLVINAICTYLMVTANRKYLQNCQNKIICILKTKNEQSPKHVQRNPLEEMAIKISEKQDNNNKNKNESLMQMDSIVNQNICSDIKNTKRDEIVPEEASNQPSNHSNYSNNVNEDLSETFGKSALSAKTTDTVTTTIMTTIATEKVHQSCTPFPINISPVITE
eukprot:448396_1